VRDVFGLCALPHTPVLPGHRVLDYARVAEAGHVADRYLGMHPVNPEDLLFRSVHLGTECWLLVVDCLIARVQERLREDRYEEATRCVRRVADVVSMLGRHLMLLMHMNQRDYFHLKAGLHGTSGAGSVKAKALRSRIGELYPAIALAQATRALPQGGADAVLQARLHPAGNPELEKYLKAMEVVDASVLTFFFQHVQLVQKTIGSGGTGTDPTPRRVAALAATYQGSVFGDMDFALSALDQTCTDILSGAKGAVVNFYEDALAAEGGGLQDSPSGSAAVCNSSISLSPMLAQRFADKSNVSSPQFDTIGGAPWSNSPRSHGPIANDRFHGVFPGR